jgi:PEGA domain
MKIRLLAVFLIGTLGSRCIAQNYSSSCSSGPSGAYCEDSEGNITMINCVGSFCSSYSGPNPLEPLLNHIFGFDRRAEKDRNIGLCLRGSLPETDPKCTEPFAWARKEYIKAFNKSAADQFKQQETATVALLHADIDGTKFVLHQATADQSRYERLMADPGFLAPLSLYGFTQFVYTNDRDKIFTSDALSHHAIDPNEAQEREVAAILKKQHLQESPETQRTITEAKQQTSAAPLSRQAQQAMAILSNPNSPAPVLPASMGSIMTVFTDPVGAEITVDGKSTGGKIRFLLLNKAASERTIVVSMNGYQPLEKKFTPDGQPITLNIKLEKLQETK